MPRKREKYITECIKVQKLIPGGQALGELASGKKVFLWGVLPGEIATKCQVTKEKNSYVEAIALEYRQPSSARMAAKDKCYLATSPWQIMDYDYELAQKAEILREVFRQHQIENGQINTVKTNGRDFYYRNKMEYALYYDHGTAKIYPAFHRRGSHQKVPILSSSIERPEIWVQAQTVVQELNAQGADARKYQSLLLRCSQDGEVSGGLLENGCPHPRFDLLEDDILGYRYSYSPNGFFQINLPVYELALQDIKRWTKTDKVLDLYAGVGTIGLSVARDRELILVESNQAAYAELERNCQGTGARAVLAKSEDALEYIQPDITVIVDPPRAGCEGKLLEKILTAEPQTVIYLSCNPATQGRDVKILLEKYQIRQVQPYNFFPRTPHLENLIVLEHRHGAQL